MIYNSSQYPYTIFWARSDTRGSLYDSSDQKCDWCDWCDLWLAFNFGPWFFFVIGVIDVICVIDVIDMIDVINVIDVIDVIGVINVISVIDVIGVIDVILLSQNMIWRTQFYCFFIFSVVTVFFCFATSENFHLSKLWKSSDNAFLFRKPCILSLISDQKLHFLYMYNQKFR